MPNFVRPLSRAVTNLAETARATGLETRDTMGRLGRIVAWLSRAVNNLAETARVTGLETGRTKTGIGKTRLARSHDGCQG